MKRERTIWIILLVLLVIGVGTLVALRNRAGAKSPGEIEYRGETGKTALELLRERATIQTTTDPRLGEFVTSINGRVSGIDDTYWIYRVNG